MVANLPMVPFGTQSYSKFQQFAFLGQNLEIDSHPMLHSLLLTLSIWNIASAILRTIIVEEPGFLYNFDCTITV